MKNKIFKTGDMVVFNREDDCEWVKQAPCYLILDSRKWFRYTVLELVSGDITTLDKSYLNKYFRKVA